MTPGPTSYCFGVLALLLSLATAGSTASADSREFGTGLSTPEHAESRPIENVVPGYQPAPESDEAGLWMVMDKVEKNLRTSGRIVNSPELNSYLKEILCKITPEYCNSIRIYVIRTPHFNASMAPNGVMQVWTGLLLRCENEAQLAHVLGHEFAHYLRRHSIQSWRNARDQSNALVFFGLLTAMAGVGFVGDLAQLIALGGIFAYSRDNEREADDLGSKFAAKAGYEPREAARIWEGLIKEIDEEEREKRSIFFATHPAPEERIETLKKWATDQETGALGEGRFHRIIRPFRRQWLRDELRRRDPISTQVVLTRLIDDGSDPGLLNYFQGELYRLRREEGDEELAITAYEKAASHPDAPAALHRSMGLVHWQKEQLLQAKTAFETYLNLAPNADDRAMIQSYIEELE